MNGKVNGKSMGVNGDGPSSIRESSKLELDHSHQLNDASGAYVNRIMLNGSAYNSPNLTNNRRDLVPFERAPGDGSLSNPDVIPSEKFSSIDNNINRFQDHENSQIDLSKSNPGILNSSFCTNSFCSHFICQYFIVYQLNWVFFAFNRRNTSNIEEK
jgi:hypothetical protein